jgi:hypothetical protein
MTGITVILIVCLVFLVFELIILSTAVKEPLHIHGNSKVLLTLFINKDEYNKYKDAAIAKGYKTIEPYIEELLKNDIDKNK